MNGTKNSFRSQQITLTNEYNHSRKFTYYNSILWDVKDCIHFSPTSWTSIGNYTPEIWQGTVFGKTEAHLEMKKCLILLKAIDVHVRFLLLKWLQFSKTPWKIFKNVTVFYEWKVCHHFATRMSKCFYL